RLPAKTRPLPSAPGTAATRAGACGAGGAAGRVSETSLLEIHPGESPGGTTQSQSFPDRLRKGIRAPACSSPNVFARTSGLARSAAFGAVTHTQPFAVVSGLPARAAPAAKRAIT